MYDVTVIVPTIGRESLTRSLESITHNLDLSRIEVMISGDSSKTTMEAIERLIPKSLKNLTYGIILDESCVGPGLVKNKGLWNSSGYYALILDDDDELQDYCLDFLIQKVFPDKPNWVNFHLTHDKRLLSDFNNVEMESCIVTESKLFNYDDWKSSGNFDVVYPVSPTVVQRRKFLDFTESKGMQFKYPYGDDVIPMSGFLHQYPGVHIKGNMLLLGRSGKSVSTHFDPKVISPVLSDLDEIIITSRDISNRNYWLKVKSNLLKRLNHVWSTSKSFQNCRSDFMGG